MYPKVKIIRAEGLLGAIRLEWHLRPSINIISGGNGSGKSTLLRGLAQMLINGQLPHCGVGPINKLQIECEEGQVKAKNVIAISRSLLSMDCQGASATQINDERFSTFCDIIDRLIEPSNKLIDRTSSIDNLQFILTTRDGQNVRFGFDWLSSGEQLAVSLFRAVAERPEASVLILDEPEISLSIEWQKILIESLLLLNENMQIIIATHSPAIIMRGWTDCVSEIDDLIL